MIHYSHYIADTTMTNDKKYRVAEEKKQKNILFNVIQVEFIINSLNFFLLATCGTNCGLYAANKIVTCCLKFVSRYFSGEALAWHFLLPTLLFKIPQASRN